MAQWRIRRLVRRLLRWVWVPAVSFVLVVAVAMGCAVWSPNQRNWSSFGHRGFHERNIPGAVRQYDDQYTTGAMKTGPGLSFYTVRAELLTTHATRIEVTRFDVLVGRSGLPFRCMRWTEDSRDVSDRSSLLVQGIATTRTFRGTLYLRRVPLMPEPVGMTLNVLIYSAAIVLPRFVWRRAVVFRRRRKSLCIMCAYPLGDFTVCPECGSPTGREA